MSVQEIASRLNRHGISATVLPCGHLGMWHKFQDTGEVRMQLFGEEYANEILGPLLAHFYPAIDSQPSRRFA